MKELEYTSPVKLSKWERETVININDEDKCASLYTCQKKMMEKMDALVEEFSDIFTVINVSTYKGDVISKTYEFPKRYVGVNKPIVLSEERKEVLREQLKAAREKKKEA